MTESARPLAVSVGDPAGVGPEVAVRAAASETALDGVVLYGDARRLEALAISAGVDAVRLRRIDPGQEGRVAPGQVALAHVGEWSDEIVEAREPTAGGGRAQLAALDAAVDAVRSGRARGIVTGPTSKEAISLGGTPFTGQTEHLARAAGLEECAVTMMFLGPRLNVALVTTHLAVRDVPAAITPEGVMRATVHLGEALLRLAAGRGAPPPRVVVAGLNPHAGEGGLFGAEEREVIRPAVERALEREPFASGAVELLGVRPAEASFRMAPAGEVGGVVAMMHDQATIASKLLDWGAAVNVTWGLPFVRTSVDHGVAYDAARDGTANADGMVAAVRMAQRLTAGAS